MDRLYPDNQTFAIRNNCGVLNCHTGIISFYTDFTIFTFPMTLLKNKYQRRTSILLISAYFLLLLISISDVHTVNITLHGSVIEKQENQPSIPSHYLFYDENGCIFHYYFSSVHQLVCYGIHLNLTPSQLIQAVSFPETIFYSGKFTPGSPFRAPPLTA